ncbi:hypothetical protein [Aureibacter tunicatorum]|uniref:Uncharacterized protein n=1 Tax=Aureibacter tunicatorum TaxID=866807 RepID=A0AAE4BS49_9BACT|nr:hypothetical protein [Aureibacter tunicatorum]MDR6238513.1 hypothetical protein [Aureibacter tunicatorum]BDD05554.1 hypothetical protein AUTU_30370 [Aureibacter tunicatorum]
MNLSFGQGIQEVFKSFPLMFTPRLTKEAKDSLISFGVYTLPGGDTTETMKVQYMEERGFIRLQYYFKTGQSGFVDIQFREFKKNDGSSVVVLF